MKRFTDVVSLLKGEYNTPITNTLIHESVDNAGFTCKVYIWYDGQIIACNNDNYEIALFPSCVHTKQGEYVLSLLRTYCESRNDMTCTEDDDDVVFYTTGEL